jgi:hypothetical protein
MSAVRMIVSYSMGVSFPSRLCRRRRWYVRSIHVVVASRRSCRVSHRWQSRTGTGEPRYECTTFLAGRRAGTAFSGAETASEDFIIESIEYRTILPEKDVFDRAEVVLALGGGVLGNVCQPQLVRRGGGEVPLHQVVVNRWSRLAVQAPLSLRTRTRCRGPCISVGACSRQLQGPSRGVRRR